MDPKQCRGKPTHDPGFHLLGKSEHSLQPGRRARTISSRKPPSSPRLAVPNKLGHKGTSLRVHRLPLKRGAVGHAQRTS